MGGAGSDEIFGEAGSDQLTGNGGDDQLYGDINDSVLSAGAGTNDILTIIGESKVVTITNTLLTVNGKKYANFGAETVNLEGSEGNDSLIAPNYTGNVGYSAYGGDDVIVTGSGNDSIYGGDGADSMTTGGGDDFISADAQDLAFNAGSGNNQMQFFNASGTITVDNSQITVNGAIRPTGTLTRLSIFSLDTNDLIDASAFSGFTGIYDQGGVNTIKTGQGGSEVMSNSLDNTVYGGNGDDNLIGVNGPYINAGAGDDQISARFAYTTVIAGDGNDRVVLSTISGNVTMTDSIKNDNGLIVTFSGIERLETGADVTNDVIDATAFKGYLVLFDAGGSNTIYAGSGGSTIYLGYSNLPNTVYGGAGDDFINASSGGAATIFGGDGNDTIYGSFTYGDWLDGGAGDDSLTGYGGADTIIGGDGNDTLIGDYGPDTYPTTLDADLIDGGNGNDTIFADGTGPGTQVFGRDGDDFIRGGNSTYVEGGNGNDMITCDFGTDQSNGVIFGGEGDDIIVALGGVKLIDGGGGNDTITAGQFDCVIHGGDGNDNIVSGPGNNVIYGDNGDDVILGGVGNDHIYGGDGDDQLYGNDGDDWLDGGTGTDQLTGGAGADTFVMDVNPLIFTIESQNWDFNPADGDVII
ncbi:MAG: calcium-binding protein [Gemmataceae bacterium]